jgi:ATP-dependent RNA circularization protein (DNA/RNA ligase family)
LESQKILNDAMFGMYGHWENRESARNMRRLCRQFMDALTQAVNAVVLGAMVFQPVEVWKISLENEEQHERVIDALTRFSCETLDLRTEPQPGLFDDLEDRGSVQQD